DQFHRPLRLGRRQPGKRLVEKEQARGRREGPGELQLLQFDHTERGGGSPGISLPRKRIEPAEGGISPVTVLNRVVLPAPLAPMRPTISPSSTAKLTPRRTSRPPKCLKTPFSSSSGMTV